MTTPRTISARSTTTAFFKQTVLMIGIACLAASASAAEWVSAGQSVDGEAKIELSKTFVKKTGKFNAMAESPLDDTPSVSGTFLVGTYRYVYKKPDQENGHAVDEMVSTELMDCKKKFYGTLKQTKKFKGKVVTEKTTPDGDVTMTQISGPTVDGQLCDLYEKGASAVTGVHSTPNPDYRPGPLTDKQADALLDKYAPPARKK